VGPRKDISQTSFHKATAVPRGACALLAPKTLPHSRWSATLAGRLPRASRGSAGPGKLPREAVPAGNEGSSAGGSARAGRPLPAMCKHGFELIARP
jgi:hypothetical protein